MQFNLDGPPRAHLTTAECAEWLGVSISTFKALVRDHQFPPPAVFGKAAKRYLWLDLVSYSHLRSRMAGNGRERRR